MAGQNFPEHTVLCICGPTASGKSAMGIDIARQYDGEIINADSVQVYKELDILSARPNSDELKTVPHHLYGCLPVSESCDAQKWRALAESKIRDCQERGKLPILVGGTGLYFKGLFEGFSPIPDVPTEIFEAGKQRHQEVGGDEFRAEIAQFDPKLAERLPAGDTQRLVRGWTVYHATGKPLSLWQQEPLSGAPSNMKFRAAVLLPPREELYQRCDLRFDKMIAAGGIAEAEALLAADYSMDLPALRAVGVRDLLFYLKGQVDWDEAVRLCKQATRRYAKRQMTWFRNQLLARSKEAGVQKVLPYEALYLEKDNVEFKAFTKNLLSNS